MLIVEPKIREPIGSCYEQLCRNQGVIQFCSSYVIIYVLKKWLPQQLQQLKCLDIFSKLKIKLLTPNCTFCQVLRFSISIWIQLFLLNLPFQFIMEQLAISHFLTNIFMVFAHKNFVLYSFISTSGNSWKTKQGMVTYESIQCRTAKTENITIKFVAF